MRICMVADPVTFVARAAGDRSLLWETELLADHEECGLYRVGRQTIEHLGCDLSVGTVVERQRHFSSWSVNHASGTFVMVNSEAGVPSP